LSGPDDFFWVEETPVAHRDPAAGFLRSVRILHLGIEPAAALFFATRREQDQENAHGRKNRTEWGNHHIDAGCRC
jgi:hypothetical protein